MTDVVIAPGPKGIPFFGSVFPAWRDPLGLMLGSRERYGDVVRFKFGPFDYYLVADPDVVKHVLVDNAKSYRKSRNYLGLKLVLGNGLLTSEGDYWRRQRKLAQPAFHRERLAGFAATMARATRDLLDRWHASDRDEGGQGRVFCIHEEMMRLTFRIVGLTLFSEDVDGDARDVGAALDTALRWANDYAEALVRIPPAIPTPANRRFKKAMKTLDAVVHRIIAARRESAKDTRMFGDDLLGMLMEAVEEGSDRGMTDQELRDEVITMVLAGHETTANLLSWTFYLLSKHPEIERRVHEEAVSVLGDREPGLADVKNLEYARMVLDEALRLYPPAWIFERQSTTEDVLGGFTIKKGSIVGISPYVLHRHPKYFENPEGFDPERFRSKTDASRPKWSYLPFGGGPRMCIGNHFAMMEAQIILAMIVRDYRLELDPSQPVIVDPVITLRPKHGVPVRRRPSSTATESSRYRAPRRPNEPRAALS
jgi:cytochrome P450